MIERDENVPRTSPAPTVWNPPWWLLAAVTATTYWLGSRVAFELAERSGLGAAFFIPAGITLAILVRTKPRQWWAVLAAAACTELLSDLNAGLGVGAAVGFAAANSIEPLAGAALTLRWATPPFNLARRRAIVSFLVGSVLIGPLLGAGIGTLTDVAANDDPWWDTLWQWWLGDALAVLVVGGAILAWTSQRSSHDNPAPWRLTALLLFVAAMPVVTMAATDVPLEFITMALVIAAGGVFGARGATTAAAVAASSIAIMLGFGESPVWVGIDDSVAWATVKAQLGVSTIVGLALAAEVFERQSQTAAVSQAVAERQSVAFTRRVLDQLISFVTVMNPDGTIIDTNHAPLRADGTATNEVIGRPVWQAPWWQHDPSVQHLLKDAVRRASGGTVSAHDVAMRIDGEDVWVELQIGPLRDDDGTVTHLIKSCTDLTDRRKAQQSLARTAASERAIRQRVELLGEVATGLTAAVTIDDIATVILSKLDPALQIDYAALIIENEGAPTVYSTADGTDGDQQDERDPSDRSLPGPAAIVTGETIVLNSPDEIGQRFPAEQLAAGEQPFASIGAFPIRSAGPAASEALLIAQRAVGWFTTDRVEMLESIATQAGEAIRRARLHEQVVAARDREQAIALRLQQSLLPDRLVAHHDLDIAAKYEAATSTLMVGGDWFDTFRWPDGHIGLMVGDVVGHDLEAAATMGRIRAALAATVPLGPADPSAVLDALDLIADGPDGTDFVTAACVVFDPSEPGLAYATAGHPPPLVVWPDGRVDWLNQAVSAPAGHLQPGHRASAEAAFADGAMVLLYTDGLVERRGESISDGLDRLARVVAEVSETRTLDAEGWVDRLIGELSGDHADDDIAVLAARIQTVPSSFEFRFPAESVQLAELRDRLRSWLAAHWVGRPTIDDVVLAVNEAASNAVKHAYLGTDPGPVSVEAELVGGELVATIRDAGDWRPPDPVSRPGRGTQIMQRLAASFTRDSNGVGTNVVLRLSTTGR